jgi:hypothetical protein
MRELTESELETLEFLGDFQPTVHIAECTVKGWRSDCGETYSVYFNSTSLRRMGADLMAVADWLEDRAEEEYNEDNDEK